jgi:tol-pal system protein YbgF
LCLAGVAACATPGQVHDVETQVGVLRADSRRADSVQAAQLKQVIALQQQVLDSLAVTRRMLADMKGEVSNDLLNVQQQLLQLQELTGQSQRRLTELRSQLEARGESVSGGAPPPVTAGDTSAAAHPAATGASAQQMFDASLAQLRRGSSATGRAGLRDLLQTYPKDALVPDALYFVGQSFASENPDSAAFYYRQVAKDYPTSARAPAALYGLGLLAERQGDKAGARAAYQQLLKTYPKSDEAALARDRLKAIGR